LRGIFFHADPHAVAWQITKTYRDERAIELSAEQSPVRSTHFVRQRTTDAGLATPAASPLIHKGLVASRARLRRAKENKYRHVTISSYLCFFDPDYPWFSVRRARVKSGHANYFKYSEIYVRNVVFDEFSLVNRRVLGLPGVVRKR